MLIIVRPRLTYCIPYNQRSASQPTIVTGEESGLVVDELDEPSVQALRVRNLDGRQNRALNVSVLAPALADLKIPVSCLERGRWGRYRTSRRDEAFTAASVRAAKNAGVAESMPRNTGRGPVGRLRLHRGLLQPAATTLSPRWRVSKPLRARPKGRRVNALLTFRPLRAGSSSLHETKGPDQDRSVPRNRNSLTPAQMMPGLGSVWSRPRSSFRLWVSTPTRPSPSR